MLKREIKIARDLLKAMREQGLDEKLQITALDLIRKLVLAQAALDRETDSAQLELPPELSDLEGET